MIRLAGLLGISWHDSLASIPVSIDSANRSGPAPPFAVANLITAISAVRPDAVVLAICLAEVVLAHKLKWLKLLRLLLPERFGAAFRTIGGRGRVRRGTPAYPKAMGLAFVDGVEEALRSAVAIDRCAGRLLVVAPKWRRAGDSYTADRRRRAGIAAGPKNYRAGRSTGFERLEALISPGTEQASRI